MGRLVGIFLRAGHSQELGSEGTKEDQEAKEKAKKKKEKKGGHETVKVKGLRVKSAAWSVELECRTAAGAGRLSFFPLIAIRDVGNGEF